MLIYDAMEPCQMLHKISTDDALGGDRVAWIASASFDAAFASGNSVEQIVGQAMVVSNTYVVTTYRSKVLEYHDVFRRLRDGKIFRVTTGDARDRQTPDERYGDSATDLDMRQVNAEEFVPAEPIAVPATPLIPATPIEVQS